MRYIKSLLIGVGVVIITALGCDVIQSNKNVPSNIEESGETLLPKIQKDKFILNFFGDDEPKKKTGNASVSWDEIESVIEIAKEQTGEELIAVFSVRDSTGEWYNYYLQPLGFSSEAMEEAQGETQLYVYELNPDSTGTVSRIAVAQLPAGNIALNEMRSWIKPDITFSKSKQNFSCYEVVIPGGWDCYEPHPAYVGSGCFYNPSYEVECNNNGNDYDPNWNWPNGGGGGSGSGGDSEGDDDCRPPACSPEDSMEELYIWLSTIDDNDLKTCMKTILNSLKQQENGVAKIIKMFAGNNPGYNWVVKDGRLSGQTGTTLPPASYNHANNSITTTFDTEAWPEATDLSWARTLMHESIHAKLSAYFAIDKPGWIASYPEMVTKWGELNNWNDVHHTEIASNIVDDIAFSLKEFGINKGYQLSDQFYKDLSWGGLQNTSEFNNLSITDKNRILDTISIELSGVDMNNNVQGQKGSRAECD